jgi:hypothetical protein
MNYNNNLISISLETDHKQCALFFDKILPLHSKETIPASICFDEYQKINIDDKLKYLISEAGRLPFYSGWVKKDKILLPAIFPFIEDLRNEFASHVTKELLRNGIPCVPIFSSFSNATKLYPDGSSNIIEISVIGAKLVDTQKVEWNQIIEFRNDPWAKEKIKRFRLFLYDNYQGKSKDYIEDSLHQKINEYEEACKKHGFELITTTIGSILDSKSAIAFTSIIVASILLGDPALRDVALLSGSAIELGKISLRFAEKKKEIDFFKHNHELAYIFEAKNKLLNNK